MRIVKQTLPSIWEHDTACFHTTHWSVVLAAATHCGSPEATQEALGNFCQTYWPPLYAFLRRRGYQSSDAQDLTQGFLANLLEQNTLSRVSREKGRLRTLLLRSLQYFLANEYDRTQTLKRGGGIEFISIDEHLAEAEAALLTSMHFDESGCYDQVWAITMLDVAWKQLHEEYGAAGKAHDLEALKPFLVGGAAVLPSQEQVAKELGVSAVTLRKSLLSVRQRYREMLRVAVTGTVSDLADVEEELHYLYRLLLSRAGSSPAHPPSL